MTLLSSSRQPTRASIQTCQVGRVAGMSKTSGKTGEKVVTLAAKPRQPCPICGRPAVKAHRPFCSARCADADLGNWISGRYRIPTEEAPEDALESGIMEPDSHED